MKSQLIAISHLLAQYSYKKTLLLQKNPLLKEVKFTIDYSALKERLQELLISLNDVSFADVVDEFFVTHRTLSDIYCIRHYTEKEINLEEEALKEEQRVNRKKK